MINSILRNNHLFNMIIIILFIFIFWGCKKDINGPDADKLPDGIGTELLYKKLINNNWEICINNLSGNKLRNISNNPHEDADAEWSPDGKYISYTHIDEYNHADIYVYDIEKGINKNISSDSVDECMAVWTPDGTRIIYQYHKIGEKYYAYIMNRDGTGKRKLLEYSSNIYFLNDKYSFIYKPNLPANGEEDNIYLSNLDGTINEFIISLKNVGKYYATLCDVNPLSKDLLLIMEGTKNIGNILVKYNYQSKTLDTISKADEGFAYYRAKYSHDYSKIVFVNNTLNDYINKIIFLDKNGKEELITFNEKSVFIDYNPMAYSPKDKYLAFSKNIIQGSSTSWWKSYLYIIDMETKKSYYIDECKSPVFNPLLSE